MGNHHSNNNENPQTQNGNITDFISSIMSMPAQNIVQHFEEELKIEPVTPEEELADEASKPTEQEQAMKKQQREIRVNNIKQRLYELLPEIKKADREVLREVIILKHELSLTLEEDRIDKILCLPLSERMKEAASLHLTINMLLNPDETLSKFMGLLNMTQQSNIEHLDSPLNDSKETPDVV